MEVECLDEDIIWEADHESFRLNEDEFLFTCFYLDPYCQDQALIMHKIYKEMIEYEFKPWLDHFIWSGKKPRIELLNRNGYTYIAGLLLYENMQDEWLLVSLLHSFSSRYQDLFIHVCDFDGECLLIELSDSIPSFLTTQTGLNRAWINSQRLLIIPNDYYPQKPLSLEKSIKFLEKSSFKLLKNDKLDLALGKIVSQYPQESLKHIYDVKVELPKDVCKIICENPPSLSSNCISVSLNGNPSVNEEALESEILAHELVSLNVKVSLLSYLSLKIAEIEHRPAEIGWYIKNGLKLLKLMGVKIVKSHNDVKLDELIADFQKDHLQEELIRLNKIPNYVASDYSLFSGEDTSKEENNTEELLNRFKKEFQDTSDPVEYYNDDSDYVSDGEDVEKLKKYFELEKVDIDEDDFFEFFCKEALKLKDEDIERFRVDLNKEVVVNGASAGAGGEEYDDNESNDENNNDGLNFEYNDESDYSSGSEDQDEEFMKKMLQALQLESSAGGIPGAGPVSSLLNSFNQE